MFAAIHANMLFPQGPQSGLHVTSLLFSYAIFGKTFQTAGGWVGIRQRKGRLEILVSIVAPVCTTCRSNAVPCCQPIQPL